MARCFEAFALTFVPSRLTLPTCLIPVSRATSSIRTKYSPISPRNRRRKEAMVSWSGWLFAAMYRKATESWVAASIFRLDLTPVAYP